MVSWRQVIVYGQWQSLLTLMTTLVSAQRYVPFSAWDSAFAFDDGRVLYIQGGKSLNNAAQVTSQMFSIDLTIPWYTSSVPFKKLNGPGGNEYISATLTVDKQRIILFGTKDSKEYDVVKGTWRNITIKVIADQHSPGSAIANPNTGKIYGLDGYKNFFTKPEPLQMHEYDPSNGAVKIIPMAPTINEPLTEIQVSWNPSTNKMAIFGKDPENTRYQHYRTWDATGGWSNTPTKGDIPFDRNNACLVSAYNGTKLLLFAGTIPGKYLDDIYIFDVATATWTQGTNAGAAQSRLSPSCAVSNDQLITWGGRTMDGEVSSNIVLVYNIKTDKWQPTYTPRSLMEPSPSQSLSLSTTTTQTTFVETHKPSNSDGNVSKASSTNLAMIIGIASGGLLAIACIAGLFILFRRKRQDQPGKEKIRSRGRDRDSSPRLMMGRKQSDEMPESDSNSDEDSNQYHRRYQSVPMRHAMNEVQSQQKSTPTGRAPQNMDNWDSQFMVSEHSTRRQPEDTSGVTTTGDPFTYNRTRGKDETMAVNTDPNRQSYVRPGNGPTMARRGLFRPGHEIPMAIPIRDPQHPRGYGNVDPRSSLISGYSIPQKTSLQLDRGSNDRHRSLRSQTGSNGSEMGWSDSNDGTTLVHEYSGQFDRSMVALGNQPKGEARYSDQYQTPLSAHERNSNESSHMMPGSSLRRPEYTSPRLLNSPQNANRKGS